MRVQEILQSKGKAVHQISPSHTLADVVALLVNFNCGSLLVTDSGKVLGIITERDILKAIHGEKQSLRELYVRDFMTQNLVTGAQGDEVGKLMGLMTVHRVRHLPILDGEQLAGMISIGDLVKAQCDCLSAENHQLMSYIQGEYS